MDPKFASGHKYSLHNMSDTNSLQQDRVLDFAARALRDGPPSLQTPYEAVALIGHACMTAVDFRLVGLGEDHNLGLNS